MKSFPADEKPEECRRLAKFRFIGCLLASLSLSLSLGGCVGLQHAVWAGAPRGLESARLGPKVAPSLSKNITDDDERTERLEQTTIARSFVRLTVGLTPCPLLASRQANRNQTLSAPLLPTFPRARQGTSTPPIPLPARGPQTRTDLAAKLIDDACFAERFARLIKKNERRGMC
jgi:hypothetical protein